MGSVDRFVREHFTISQFDAFMGYNFAWEDMKALEDQIRSGVVFHDVDTTTYTMAITIAKRLKALKELRTQISEQTEASINRTTALETIARRSPGGIGHPDTNPAREIKKQPD
jgi:hypothetical protein